MNFKKYAPFIICGLLLGAWYACIPSILHLMVDVPMESVYDKVAIITADGIPYYEFDETYCTNDNDAPFSMLTFSNQCLSGVTKEGVELSIDYSIKYSSANKLSDVIEFQNPITDQTFEISPVLNDQLQADSLFLSDETNGITIQYERR